MSWSRRKRQWLPANGRLVALRSVLEVDELSEQLVAVGRVPRSTAETWGTCGTGSAPRTARWRRSWRRPPAVWAGFRRARSPRRRAAGRWRSNSSDTRCVSVRAGWPSRRSDLSRRASAGGPSAGFITHHHAFQHSFSQLSKDQLYLRRMRLSSYIRRDGQAIRMPSTLRSCPPFKQFNTPCSSLMASLTLNLHRSSSTLLKFS